MANAKLKPSPDSAVFDRLGLEHNTMHDQRLAAEVLGLFLAQLPATLQLLEQGRQVQVAVRDQGPGIPSAQREQVFDRFWSGADRGGHSGLGLAIGRAIARRHGGELRLGESRPGLCVLLVELPAATNPPQTS